MRVRTVSLMWEYFCEYSPVWSVGRDLPIGPTDVAEYGVSDGLREALADWNGRCEIAADPDDLLPGPASPAEWRDLVGESFGLAAQLQRELGDDWTVWCATGGGYGGMGDPGAFDHTVRTEGPQYVLRPSGIRERLFDGSRDALPSIPQELRGRWRRWALSEAWTSHAEFRAAALELAADLHAALPTGRVLWFGGEDLP